MRYLKMLGLAAVAAMALTAFLGAGSASATVLCKTTLTEGCATAKQTYGKGTVVTSTSSKTILNGLWTDVTCTKSEVSGPITDEGSATKTVKGNIEVLKFEECGCSGSTHENKAHVTVLEKGEIELHHISGTHEGTLTVRNTKATVNCTPLGSQCVFGVGNEFKDVGRQTHPEPEATYPTVHANLTLSRFDGPSDEGSFICGNTAAWEGTYTVTSPHPATVAAS